MIDRRALALGLIVLVAVAGRSWAGEPPIVVTHPWAPPTEARLGIAYVTLTASGDGDQLLGAETVLADQVEIRNAAGEAVHWLNLVPGLSAVLHPGGGYLALIGLKSPLIAGTVLPLTLHFSAAGEVAVRVVVEAAPQ